VVLGHQVLAGVLIGQRGRVLGESCGTDGGRPAQS